MTKWRAWTLSTTGRVSPQCKHLKPFNVCPLRPRNSRDIPQTIKNIAPQKHVKGCYHGSFVLTQHRPTRGNSDQGIQEWAMAHRSYAGNLQNSRVEGKSWDFYKRAQALRVGSCEITQKGRGTGALAGSRNVRELWQSPPADQGCGDLDTQL